jgi:hypothetical protein
MSASPAMSENKKMKAARGHPFIVMHSPQTLMWPSAMAHWLPNRRP